MEPRGEAAEHARAREPHVAAGGARIVPRPVYRLGRRARLEDDDVLVGDAVWRIGAEGGQRLRALVPIVFAATAAAARGAVAAGRGHGLCR